MDKKPPYPACWRPEYGRGTHPYAQGFYAAMDTYDAKEPKENPYSGEFEREARTLWNEGWDTFISCCIPNDYEDIRL